MAGRTVSSQANGSSSDCGKTSSGMASGARKAQARTWQDEIVRHRFH